MDQRRFVLLYVGVIALAVIVGLILRAAKSQPSKQPMPAARVADPPPAVISPLPQSVSTFAFSGPVTLPKTLPGFSITRGSRDDLILRASAVARTLSLNATPSAVIFKNSFTKTWAIQGEVEFTATQNGADSSLLFRRILSKAPADFTASPEKTASSFVTFLLGGGGLVLHKEGQGDASTTGLLVLDAPYPSAFTDFRFSYLLGDIPVTDARYDVNAASVVVDSNNVVRFANVDIPPDIKNQVGQITLLTKDDVLSSLRAGRAGILFAFSPRSPEWGVPPRFSSLSIDSVRVVYAPKGDLLLPAYILSGTGVTPENDKQGATLFMWAFSGS